MERNLERYRLLQALAGALFWLPTSILFFIDRLGLPDALRLQGVYYLAVVVFEVPSGWFSDRVGRVLTLRLAALWWVAANLVFLLADGFATLAVAQVLIAMGFAFASGTDVTFHYDTLESLDRAGEFEPLEASARRVHLTVLAASAFCGGLLALIDLRLPFLAALVATAAQTAVAFSLTEPTGTTPDRGGHRIAAVRALGDRLLCWLALYVVGEVITVHLTSELAAPYAASVAGETLEAIGRAPAINGSIVMLTALAGAVAVRFAGTFRARFGAIGALVVVAAIPVVNLSAMAAWTSAIVLVLILTRSVQAAFVSVLVPAIVAPRVGRHQRATLLSINSLLGRFGYGAVLLIVATSDGLDEALIWSAAIAVGFFVVSAATAMLIRAEAP